MHRPASQAGSAGISAAAELRLGCHTDPGRVRGNNEDRIRAFDLAAGRTVGSDKSLTATVHPPGLLLIVADGMGGTMAGEMASQMCVELLPELLRKRLERKGALGADAARHALVAAVEETHQRILGRASARPECKGMGTTCTAALVDGSLARIAQVGDSRAYLYRRGKIAQLTRDQTVWETMRNGEEEPGPEFKDAPWKNMLVQAVGAQPALEVAVTEHALESDDWLLLCSDGLYRVVKAEELAAELKSKRDPAEKARRLAELANQRGGPDNVSVVVCHVAEAGG